MSILTLLSTCALLTSLNGVFATPPLTDGEYGIVIEGYDWGNALYSTGVYWVPMSDMT